MNKTEQNVSLADKTNDGVGNVKKGKNTRITQQMAKLEMTQTELAKRSGLHLTNVNAIVNGSRPNVDTAIKIARALNKSVEELWGNQDNTKEHP